MEALCHASQTLYIGREVMMRVVEAKHRPYEGLSSVLESRNHCSLNQETIVNLVVAGNLDTMLPEDS